MQTGWSWSTRCSQPDAGRPEQSAERFLPSADMLAVMHKRKKNPRGKSSFLGHRLATLQCPLLAKPNIAPAGKGEILEHVQSTPVSKVRGKKSRQGREVDWEPSGRQKLINSLDV